MGTFSWPPTIWGGDSSRFGYRGEVGSSADDRHELLEGARAALRAHRYGAAYGALRSAQGVAPLDVEDLHRLAEAAWWLGLMSECLPSGVDTKRPARRTYRKFDRSP